MLKNYIKIAWRSLWKHPKTTLINLVGLTIGIAASVLITLWVKNEFSFDNYHNDADNIYRIKTKLTISPTETWHWETSSYRLGEFAKKEIPQINQLTRIAVAYGGLLLDVDGEKIKEKDCAYVDENWFKMFHYDFVAGSVRSFQQNPYSLILTASTAKKYFGRQDAIGQILKIDTINYKVEGIIKDNPTNSSFQINILIPTAARFASENQKKNDLSWGNYSYMTFINLQPGSNINAVGKQLTGIQRRNQQKSSAQFSLIGLKDIHFESDIQRSSFQHGNPKMVRVFSILAVLLMITACINYVNLTTARASVRSKEVSVRKIVGAGRPQLFGQFIAESFIVTALALGFAVLVILLSIPFFNTLTGQHFTQPLAERATWLVLAATLLTCTALNGIYPALMLSSFQPLNVFRGKSLLSLKDTGLRKSLVIVQFVISVVLIIATLVIYLQMDFLHHTDIGYSKAHLFTMEIPWRNLGRDDKKNTTFLATIKTDLQQQSPIARVTQASADIVEMNGGNSGGFDWDGRSPKFDPAIVPISTPVDFNELLKFKLTAGHWFTKGDQHNVILNETAIKELGIHKPVIGQRFINRGDTGVVIGVVKDFHYQSLHEKIGSLLIDNHPEYMTTFYIETREGNTAQALAAAQKVWQKYVLKDPFEYSFMEDKYNSLYTAEERLSTLITFFAGVAILVSALGLLGLAAFTAEQRIKEIGIRKVLGASVSHIVKLLSTDFVKMVLIASVIAFPIAWWAMNKWLQDFAYRISIGWWVFALGAAVALIIALITTSIEALRSAMANPVKSLRSE